jgi:zinc protease
MRATSLGALALALLAGCPPRVEKKPLEEYDKKVGPRSEADYWKGRSDLIKAPPVQPAHALKIPAVSRLKLQNGLSVLLLPDPQLPLIDVQLLIPTGAIDDPRGHAGLAEFTAAMLRQGTRRMKADRISETVDMAGVSLGADSDYELSSVGCRGRKKSVELCLRMVSDLITRPTFPKGEMDEIRDQLLSSVKNMRDDPEILAAVHFDAMLYGDDHPGGWVKSERSVRSISRDDLVRFHGANYRPDKAILAVSGDFDQKAVQALVRRAFDAWKGGRARTRKAPTPVKDPPPGIKVLLVDKPDLSQSFFALGHAGIRRTHPDRDAVSVMNYILGGGGFSSRLMATVRGKGGKTYGISSYYYRAAVDGSFVVQSFTRNDQLVATLELTRGEMQRIHREPPTKVELTAAKGKIAGGYPIRLKTSSAIARRLMEAQIWGLPDSEVVEFAVRIDRLTLDQVARAARRYVRPGRLYAAVVGKAVEVAPLLRKARIPFEQISYLDPVSARERKELKEQPKVEISPGEQKAASKLLDLALRVAGGPRVLARIKRLHLSGEAKVTAKGHTLGGSYGVKIILPDHMRITLDLKPVMSMVQVLAGDKAWLEVGKQRKTLPPHVVRRWKGMLWREPTLVLLNATRKDVRSRVLKTLDGLGRGQVAVEVFPPGLPAATLIINRQSGQLVQIRYRDRTGQWRVSELAKHRRFQGILIPLRVSSVNDRRQQSVHYKRVQLNPKIDLEEITGGAP